MAQWGFFSAMTGACSIAWQMSTAFLLLTATGRGVTLGGEVTEMSEKREPSPESIAFARRVYGEMMGNGVSTRPIVAEQMATLAIAFDALARANREAVAAEAERCATLVDEGTYDSYAGRQEADRVAKAIRNGAAK